MIFELPNLYTMMTTVLSNIRKSSPTTLVQCSKGTLLLLYYPWESWMFKVKFDGSNLVCIEQSLSSKIFTLRWVIAVFLLISEKDNLLPFLNSRTWSFKLVILWFSLLPIKCDIHRQGACNEHQIEHNTKYTYSSHDEQSFLKADSTFTQQSFISVLDDKLLSGNWTEGQGIKSPLLLCFTII